MRLRVKNCLRVDGQHGPGHKKTYLFLYMNNKGADQTAHLPSLISTFVVS